MRFAPLSLLLLLLLAPIFAGSDDWPGWRGPTGNGISPLKNLPTTWAADKNIAWKTPVPGKGHSSPVVWGNRVFITVDIAGDPIPGKVIPKHIVRGQPFRNPDSGSADRKHTLKALCFDATTGKQIWEHTLFDGEVYDEVHKTANYATTTAVTDGKYVYFSFGAEGYYKLDYDGKVLWKCDLGKIDTVGLGYGPSPVLFEDKVIVLADQDDGDRSFIAAISAADGKVVWKTPRKIGNTWGTPVLVEVDGKKQIIANGADNVISYDPRTGAELWRVSGPGGFVVHTPVFGQGMMIASVGFPIKKVIGIRLNPKEAEERIAWKYEKGTSYVPSPLLYDEYLYLTTDSGIVTCLDPRTGEIKYEGKRVPKPGRFNSAMVAFDGKILLSSEDGDTYVIKAGPEFDVLSTNSIGEPIVASLALAGDSIYIRSTSSLMRIRNAR
jgi:outer membrane protein assembly factor BamB